MKKGLKMGEVKARVFEAMPEALPDEATIEAAYRRIHELHSLNVAIERAHDQARADAADVEVPADIGTLVATGIEDEDHRVWDDVLADLVTEAIEEAE